MEALTIAEALELIRINVAAPVFAGIVFFMLFLAGVGTTVYFIHMKPDGETG